MTTLFDDIHTEEEAALPVVQGSLAERMPPRDYQAEANGEFLRAYEAGERHLLYRLATGLGKAQPIWEKVLTPYGWVAIGDLRVGDLVIGVRGEPVRVTGVYPQGARDIYKIECSDHATTYACAEHLWRVRDKYEKRRRKPGKVVTTAQMARSIHRRWEIPIPLPIKFPEADLPVDPYALGILIGDGSLSSSAVGFSTADPFIVEKMRSAFGDDQRVVYRSKYDYGIVRTEPGRRNPVKVDLEHLGLQRKKSDKKFIPIEYMQGSVNQRLSLLRGLMDSDGTVVDGCGASFSTSSKELANDVIALVRSLAGTARMTVKKTVGLDSWRVTLRMPPGVNPFLLPRKSLAYRPRGKYKPARIVDSVELSGRAECVCIQVDSPDRLYVTNDFIVTHNTYCGALTAEHWLRMSDKNRVLVLAYERGLVHQFREELQEFLPGVEVGLEMSNDGTVGRWPPPVTCASRQSLYLAKDDSSRLFKFDAKKYNWLIIPDECHGWKYSMPSCKHIVDWFEQNPDSAWLGLTATPERGDGVSLARLFGHVCVEMRLSRAISEGYLVPLKQKFIQVTGVDFAALREVAGDFDEGELDAILSEREQLLSMAVPLLETVGTRRTLVFVPGVNCAKALAATINAEIKARNLPHGPADYMVGATPEDVRAQTISAHQSGRLQFMIVCGLCRAGYNDPGIECVAVFRPTKSRVMAEQMKGRGVRALRGTLKPGMSQAERLAAIAASAKPSCLILDLVGVSGMPEVASTAHLLASGEADEVVERANQIVAADENDDTVEEAIEKAKSQIAEEREAARLAAEERKRREQEEYDRRAKIRGKVQYQARDVDGLRGSAVAAPGPIGDGPTDKQVRALVRLGWGRRDAERLTKRQASAIIGKSRSNAGEPYRPAPKADTSAPPTDKQIRVLERHGIEVPPTFGEAAKLITSIKWEPVH